MKQFDIERFIDLKGVIQEFAEDYCRQNGVADQATFVQVINDLDHRPSVRLFVFVNRVGHRLVLNVLPHDRLLDIFAAVRERVEGVI